MHSRHMLGMVENALGSGALELVPYLMRLSCVGLGVGVLALDVSSMLPVGPGRVPEGPGMVPEDPGRTLEGPGRMPEGPGCVPGCPGCDPVLP